MVLKRGKENIKKNICCNVFLRLIVFSFLLVLFFNFVSASSYAVRMQCDAYMDGNRQAFQRFIDSSGSKETSFLGLNQYPLGEYCTNCNFCNNGVEKSGCNRKYIPLKCESEEGLVLSDIIQGWTPVGGVYSLEKPKLTLSIAHGCCGITDAKAEVSIGENIILKTDSLSGGADSEIGGGFKSVVETDVKKPVSYNDNVIMVVTANAMWYDERVNAIFEAEFIDGIPTPVYSLPRCGNWVTEIDNGEQCDNGDRNTNIPPSNIDSTNPAGMYCDKGCEIKCTKKGYKVKRIDNGGVISYVCMKSKESMLSGECTPGDVGDKYCAKLFFDDPYGPKYDADCKSVACVDRGDGKGECKATPINEKGTCDICKRCYSGNCEQKKDENGKELDCECEDGLPLKDENGKVQYAIETAHCNIKYPGEHRICFKEMCKRGSCRWDPNFSSRVEPINLIFCCMQVDKDYYTCSQNLGAMGSHYHCRWGLDYWDWDNRFSPY